MRLAPLAPLTLLIAYSVAGAAPPPTGGVVLLRNGSLLRGVVEPHGAYVRIVNQGSEIRIPAADVWHAGASPEEVYHALRRDRPQPVIEDHLRLADWCVKQGLWDLAARELVEARAADADDPRVAIVESRLRQAYAQRATATAAPPAPAPLQEAPAPQGDALTHVSPAAIEHFSRHVQPILVNNCTTGGCHRPGSDHAFQLNRDLLHGLSDRRSTMANLATTLAAIDLQAPGRSPLLRAGVEPHGGRPTPVFLGRHGKLQRRLEGWVGMLARDLAATQTSSPALAGARPPLMTGARAGGAQNGVVQASYEVESRGGPQPSAEAPAPTTTGQAPLRGDDPFDPAAFNSRRGG